MPAIQHPLEDPGMFILYKSTLPETNSPYLAGGRPLPPEGNTLFSTIHFQAEQIATFKEGTVSELFQPIDFRRFEQFDLDSYESLVKICCSHGTVPLEAWISASDSRFAECWFKNMGASSPIRCFLL